MSLKPKCLIFICFIIIFSTLCNDGEAQSSSVCLSQTSCDKCLEADPSCAWCTDRAYNMTTPRCMTKNELIIFNCDPKFIEESKKLEQNVLNDVPLGDYSHNNYDASQIRPQKIKLNLRKGESQHVKMTFRPALNYPLDLYYLMDLTWSMKDDKETLAQMGGSLAKALNNLTINNRLGFGSFADKPAMPYIMTREIERANPCAVEGTRCAPTYLYRHQLSLTDDVEKFIQQVNASEITGNIDNMEGGLEALMQVLVCDDSIGWQDKSRKIVVFASDGQMHVAGMGLLGGVVQRNDKMCHLDSKGEYTNALQQDYPSLEEIYNELVNRKVNVIFAVTQEQIQHYQGIQSVMAGLTSVGALQSDSSNILQLVENGFKEVSRKVNFHDDAPSFIKVDYFTTCRGKYSAPIQSSSCDNVEIGNEYEFDVKLTLLENPDSPTIGRLTQQSIKIEEASLTDANLLIDVVLEWTCPCLRDEQGDPESRLCNGQGEMKCGMCFCQEGFVGKTCDCNLRNFTTTRQLEEQCHDPRDITDALCTNNGECLCGECYCNNGWEGKYCECPNCQTDCGGADHGKCDCGKCECRDGWTGDNCECTTSLDTCIAPNSNQVCSGKGDCECGECQCGQGYFGQFCESRVGEESSLCLHYQPCVEAKVRKSMGQDVESYVETCTSNQTNLEHDHVFLDELPESDTVCIARIKGADYICEYKFTYKIDPFQPVTLQIQNQTCPPANYAMLGFLTALIVTLLAGIIALVAWKVCTTVADQREYARFESQVNQTNTMYTSPLYRSPKTEYKNPQFTFEQTDIELK